jgi:hypothetical protein
MTLADVRYRLKVQQIEQTCLFELSWGMGQHLFASLPFPPDLPVAYQQWQRAYLNFYTSLPRLPQASLPADSQLRGRLEGSGRLTPSPIDWQARLVQAEAHLLYEFHRWLRSAELFDIRSELARAADERARAAAIGQDGDAVDVFLSCFPLDIARLPWETWEIGQEFSARGSIRFTRTPVTVRTAAGAERAPHRSHLRVLAILGDSTGLNFQGDREAVRSLATTAEVQFVGWQPGLAASELKESICRAIADERGWDILFFAGHSQETAMTGGELTVAAGVALSIRELAPYLTAAKERGLQFAIFNSCNGLSIADALIDLGLSQVAVMREAIHNQIAQDFLVQFLQGLANFQDVHNALRSACQFLKLKRNLTYPSAYLVPSLFRHPETELFRLEPSGWRRWRRQWQPSRHEAIAVAALLLFSLLPPAQDMLLNYRIWTQAVFRNLTSQQPDLRTSGNITPAGGKVASPPILLVQIDEESIRQAALNPPNPIDRRYLARLMTRLTALGSREIGLDYLLDRPRPAQDAILARAVRAATERGALLVFATNSIPPAAPIAPPARTLSGDVRSLPSHLRLPRPEEATFPAACPFAYIMALVATVRADPTAAPQLHPDFNHRTNQQAQLVDLVRSIDSPDSAIAHLKGLQPHPITTVSAALGQLWLRPILDFSIPPHHVYTRVPAWQLLDPSASLPADADPTRQIALVAPGGYDEAGVEALGEDNFPVPLATRYWRSQAAAATNDPSAALEKSSHYTGAESHAYATHHFLRQHYVIPIPDAWMVLVAALLGKATVVRWQRHSARLKGPTRSRLLLVVGTTLYACVGWQVYLAAAILLPWLLPSATYWIYVFPTLTRRNERA